MKKTIILILGILLFMGVANAGTDGILKSNLTADCTIESATFTSGTAFTSNQTIIYNVTHSTNWTNATSFLKVTSRNVDEDIGSETVFAGTEATANFTQWSFAVSDLPNGNYDAQATVYFSNLTDVSGGVNATLIEGGEFSDHKVLCASRPFSVNVLSGGTPKPISGSTPSQEQNINPIMIIVGLGILWWLITKK